MEKLLEAVLECDSTCLGVFDNVGYDLKKIADGLVADRVKPTLSNIAEQIFYKGKNEFWDAYGKAIHDREQKQIALKGIQGREVEYEQLQKEIDELLTLCPDEDMALHAKSVHQVFMRWLKSCNDGVIDILATQKWPWL